MFSENGYFGTSAVSNTVTCSVNTNGEVTTDTCQAYDDTGGSRALLKRGMATTQGNYMNIEVKL